jgi:hypothetical protein
MFCSIEDAWGEKSFTDKQIFKQSDRPEHFENNQNKEQQYSKYMGANESNQSNQSNDGVEHFSNNQKNHNQSQVCVAVETHLAKCAHCRRKYGGGGSSYSQMYSRHGTQPYSFDFSGLGMGIRSNKDIVTIFLFGLLVILLLQLFSK